MISVLVNLSEGDVVAGYLGEQVYPVAGYHLGEVSGKVEIVNSRAPVIQSTSV